MREGLRARPRRERHGERLAAEKEQRGVGKGKGKVGKTNNVGLGEGEVVLTCRRR